MYYRIITSSCPNAFSHAIYIKWSMYLVSPAVIMVMMSCECTHNFNTCITGSINHLGDVVRVPDMAVSAICIVAGGVGLARWRAVAPRRRSGAALSEEATRSAA